MIPSYCSPQEMIALDYQPVSVVEDVGFLRFVAALEPRYNVPSRKYMTETVLESLLLIKCNFRLVGKDYTY